MKVIRKAGLLHIRDGRMLLCRKRSGTQLLILPGGKFEPGESALDCLRREIAEELGDHLELTGTAFVGTYSDLAAGHADTLVEIELYRGELSGEPAAQSEIAELIWFDAGGDRDRLSATLRNRILPDLEARGLLANP